MLFFNQGRVYFRYVLIHPLDFGYFFVLFLFFYLGLVGCIFFVVGCALNILVKLSSPVRGESAEIISNGSKIFD